MDNDRIVGAANTVACNIKHSLAKGDRKTVAEGKAEVAEEKAQNAIGGIRDTIRGKAKPSPSPVPARLPEVLRQYRAPVVSGGENPRINGASSLRG